MSLELHEMLEDAVKEATEESPLQRGVIAEDAAGPGQMIYVVVPSFDSSARWGPCTWKERVEVGDDGHVNVIYPSEDDACLIATDENGQVWILDWWPYGL